MKFDAVLYDFDGTLVDTIPMIVNSFHYAFQKVLSIQKSDDVIKSTIGLPLWTAFQEYDVETQKALHAAYQEENERLLPHAVEIFDGIEIGLRKIQAMGVTQGVVTSKRREPALFTMKQFNIDSFFDIIVSREDTAEHKPGPAPLLFAAEQLGISDMKRILYVGDSVHDLRCAHSAGAASAAVAWTRMPEEELKAENPTYWIESLDSISCILESREL